MIYQHTHGKDSAVPDQLDCRSQPAYLDLHCLKNRLFACSEGRVLENGLTD